MYTDAMNWKQHAMTGSWAVGHFMLPIRAYSVRPSPSEHVAVPSCLQVPALGQLLGDRLTRLRVKGCPLPPSFWDQLLACLPHLDTLILSEV